MITRIFIKAGLLISFIHLFLGIFIGINDVFFFIVMVASPPVAGYAFSSKYRRNITIEKYEYIERWYAEGFINEEDYRLFMRNKITVEDFYVIEKLARRNGMSIARSSHKRF